MITEQNDYDLSLIAEHFTECGTYNTDAILAELRYYQKRPDFLCLIITDVTDYVDGFLIGYRYRDSLWLAQIWHKPGSSLLISKEAVEDRKSVV